MRALLLSLSRPGELAELKADLQGDNKIKKKEAVKKINANVTVGKDVRYVLVIERFNHCLAAIFSS